MIKLIIFVLIFWLIIKLIKGWTIRFRKTSIHTRRDKKENGGLKYDNGDVEDAEFKDLE